MYRIAICDDEPDSLQNIYELVEKFFGRVERQSVIEKYSNGVQLKNGIANGKFYDIILLDIEMPDISGMELAAFIRKKYSEVILIFITAHEQYAIKSFELMIFRYIPKSMIENMIDKALAAAIQKLDIQEGEMYIVEKANEIYSIAQNDIMYIYRDGKNAVICSKSVVLRTRKPLKDVFETLNQMSFIFVERGYIVNIAQIQAIEKDIVILKNQERIPISSSRIQEIKKRVVEYWKRKKCE